MITHKGMINHSKMILLQMFQNKTNVTNKLRRQLRTELQIIKTFQLTNKEHFMLLSKLIFLILSNKISTDTQRIKTYMQITLLKSQF